MTATLSSERHTHSSTAGITVSNVTRTFVNRSGQVPALRDVTFSAAPGQIVAVVGPSGCGKSTLLELICGLQSPDGGRIEAGATALMPQHDALLPWATALDNAALALRLAGATRAEARVRALPFLERFGLSEFARALPATLSGGMRQRVSFVRCLLADRPILALDEPFAALDAITRAEMQTWLAGALIQEPRTVVLVTHDVEEAALLADLLIVLSPRPGHPVAELAITLPRPRERTDPAIQAIRERALSALGLGFER